MNRQGPSEALGCQTVSEQPNAPDSATAAAGGCTIGLPETGERMCPCRDHEEVHRRLQREVETIHEAWREASLLKGFLAARQELLPTLQQQGLAGYMLASTIRDGILIGCRRAIDVSDDAQSIPSAVAKLNNRVGEMEPSCLVHGLDPGGREEVGYRENEAQAAFDRLEQVDWNERAQDLRNRHQATWQTLTRRLAHASNRDAPGEIDEQLAGRAALLLDDVLAEARLAHGHVMNVELADFGISVDDVHAVSTALQVFDWAEFVEALAEHERSTGRYIPIRGQAEATVRVTYSWPDPREC